MFCESVPSPVADAADFVVGAGEVEPGADMPASAGVEQRDGVAGTGQPPQDPAGLLPVWVRVVRVSPWRPAAFRRPRVCAVPGLGGDFLCCGRSAGAGSTADWCPALPGDDPLPRRRCPAAKPATHKGTGS